MIDLTDEELHNLHKNMHKGRNRRKLSKSTLVKINVNRKLLFQVRNKNISLTKLLEKAIINELEAREKQVQGNCSEELE